MEVWGGERLRDGERSPGSEAPLCLPWGAWARGPAETTPPTALLTSGQLQAACKREGGNKQGQKSWLLLGMHPWIRAIPCLPSWDTWVGPCQTYFLVTGCYWKNMGETEGQEEEKNGEGREYMGRGLPPQILRVPERRFPGAWPWPCPRGALSSVLYPLPDSPRAARRTG